MGFFHGTAPGGMSSVGHNHGGMGAGLQTSGLSGLEAWDDPAHQRAQTMDAAESYFECITTCSLEDGECVTRCVELLREQA